MQIQVVNSIPRNVVLSNIKELNIKTPRPSHTMKTSDLLEFLPEVGPVEKPKKVKEASIKNAILELHLQGLSAGQIKEKMPTTRPMYIYTVIRNYNRTLTKE